jgi:hypothetical protein
MNRLTSKCSVLVALGLFTLVLPLLAQNSGTITGTVVDSQGAVIPGASSRPSLARAARFPWSRVW